VDGLYGPALVLAAVRGEMSGRAGSSLAQQPYYDKDQDDHQEQVD
jgi:hypothetical protein